MRLFGFTSANGKNWIARRVDAGDRYGHNDCLIHQDEAMIEFYDCDNRGSFGQDHLGQFVSRYYITTLRERNPLSGLWLHGGEPLWALDCHSVAKVLKSLGDECYVNNPSASDSFEITA